jgi:uncharacterized protein YhhL (DUF1145 family)
MTARTARLGRWIAAHRYRGLALVLGALALVLLGIASRSKVTSPWDIAPAAIAGGCFLSIDLMMRRLVAEHARCRLFLPAWCLVPFGLVFLGGAAQHYHTREDALDEVARLADEIRDALNAAEHGPTTRAPRTATSRPATPGSSQTVSAELAARSGSAGPDSSGARSAGTRASEPIARRSAADAVFVGIGPVISRFAPAGVAGPSIGAPDPTASENAKAEPQALAGGPANAAAGAGRAASDLERSCVSLPASSSEGASSTPGSASTREHRRYPAACITKLVEQLAMDRRGACTDENEIKRFSALARTVANDLNIRALRSDLVKADANTDTFAEFLLALAVQGLFVFWIPGLLAVAIAKARPAVDRQLPRLDFMPNGVRRSRRTRDENILGEKRSLFVPRTCFALLLLLGTNYVFAPLGLKTTYMMTLVDQHVAPGQTSFTLWTTCFSQSPVITAGFLGFLLYAVITATHRFAQDDFDDQAMFSLLVRGLVVMLLSFALSASPIEEQISRTFVFVAGVFPVRALEALAKKVSISLDPDFSSDGAGSFEGLPSLDPTKAFALRAAGIQSTADLAAMDINIIAERVRINPCLLGRTVDRAILLDAIGKPLADKLEECGIRLATELVAIRGEIPKQVFERLGETAQLVAERLASDSRVEALREWVENTSEAPVCDQITDKVKLGQAIHKLVNGLDGADANLAAEQFVMIDLADFGHDQRVPLLHGVFPDFGQLVDAVYSLFSHRDNIDRYQYGRQWELRTIPGDPSTAIPHARVAVKLWGIPVPDATTLGQRGITGGRLLFAVRVRQASLPRL